MGDNQGHTTKDGRESSDNESLDNAMDETPDSLQDGLSSLESQSSSSAVSTLDVPSEDTQATQSEKTAATAEARTSEETPGKPDVGESDGLQSTQEQTFKTSDDNPTQQTILEDNQSTTSESGPAKNSKATNPKDQKTDRKNSKNSQDPAKMKQPTLDQNANVDQSAKQTGQTKQKGKNEQDLKQKATPAAQQKMVFGSQTPTQVILTKIYEK